MDTKGGKTNAILERKLTSDITEVLEEDIHEKCDVK
jgi:hypothetical protein